MLVKATKAMAALLQKNIPEYKIMLANYSRAAYQMNVDYDLFENEVDFSPRTGEFRAIKIIYPPDCYAMPEHLTTRKLNSLFRKSDKTEAGFIEEVRNAIAI